MLFANTTLPHASHQSPRTGVSLCVGLVEGKMQIFSCRDTDSHKQPGDITTDLFLKAFYFFIQLRLGWRNLLQHICLSFHPPPGRLAYRDFSKRGYLKLQQCSDVEYLFSLHLLQHHLFTHRYREVSSVLTAALRRRIPRSPPRTPYESSRKVGSSCEYYTLHVATLNIVETAAVCSGSSDWISYLERWQNKSPGWGMPASMHTSVCICSMYFFNAGSMPSCSSNLINTSPRNRAWALTTLWTISLCQSITAI